MVKNYGGKANSLIQLRENKFNVPKFFIIDCSDYEYFLQKNNLKEKIEELHSTKNDSQIQKIIMSSEIPQELKDKIEKEWGVLHAKHVSVRSSATNEDGEKKSFAGQYETFLGISFEELYDAIKKCWCSLYEDNVVLYSDAVDLYGMNVIIQEMVYPDYAGVAFSKDITSTTGNYSIIEIVKGSGDKLVSGEITPTKLLVRRQTSHVDLKIGDIEVPEEMLVELEKNLLEIETLYQKAVDIEYAIRKGELYILQARPITAHSVIKTPYSLTITRPKSIIEEEIYFQGEYKGIQKITRGLYYFKPLFLYQPENKNVGVYYNGLDLEEDPNMMYYYMDLDYDKIKQYYETIKKDVVYLRKIIEEKKDIILDEYLIKIVSIYPFTSLGQLAGHFEGVSARIQDVLYDFRNHYDSIVHEAIDYLIEIVRKSLPDEIRDMVDFITLEEYQNKQFPSLDVLKQRQKGYIYFGKLYVTEDYETWLEEHHKYIKVEESSELKGQTAFSGTVTGRVCKVFSEQDFSKFQKGDILVTPMTVPKFIKIMKQASAIVTDEGGVTCHAAIISRELQIPCIVGCKNITKVLQDGDFIEVCADIGEVRVLEKNEL